MSTRPPFHFRIVLNYTDPDRLLVLHKVPVDLDNYLYVVGDPDNGSYEWVLDVPAEGQLKHSDSGYGQPDIALRDGLIAYHGAPDTPPLISFAKRRPR